MAEVVVKRIAIYPSGPTTAEPRRPYYLQPGATGLKVGTTPQIGAWQTFELIQDGNDFYVDAPAANKTLSLTPHPFFLHGWDLRQRGTRGSWERLKVQQEATANGNRLALYRYHFDQLLGFFDFVEI